MTRRHDLERDLVRQALTRATAEPEAGLEPLADAVPGILAEAARQRQLEAPLDALSAAALLARMVLPRLALATAILAAVATAALVVNGSTNGTTGDNAETLLLGDNSLTDERIVDALVSLEDGR